GLLGGEATCKVPCRLTAAVRITPLLLGEEAPQGTLAVALDEERHPADLNYVDPESPYHSPSGRTVRSCGPESRSRAASSAGMVVIQLLSARENASASARFHSRHAT